MSEPTGAVDEIAQLRAVHDALLEQLHAGTFAGVVSGEERARLKQEIAVLFLQVDRRLAALAALKEDVKALVGAWKQLPPPRAEHPLVSDAADTSGRAGFLEELDAPADAEPGAAPVPAMQARTPIVEQASVRVDHLGASTFVAKGWTAISLGEFARAEETLVRALELAPDDPEAGSLLGWALMGQGRMHDARLACERVLARVPGFALARVNLGYIALRRGAHDEAVVLLTEPSLDEGDRKAALYATFYLGLVALRRGAYDDAEAYFRRALAHAPNLLEAYYETGRARWLAGDRDGAREAWRAGAASGKFNPWGARCADVLVEVDRGGAPPPLD
jgi:Flp pilus assembly protein TadD